MRRRSRENAIDLQPYLESDRAGAIYLPQGIRLRGLRRMRITLNSWQTFHQICPSIKICINYFPIKISTATQAVKNFGGGMTSGLTLPNG
ncbi:MAG: hypothetical protein V7L13_23915 [Nostoc sp.]|uniref:hypothetical protein n=1 Tax=Nostoc sp. TaxID=1180 RepID=UPI002FF4F312